MRIEHDAISAARRTKYIHEYPGSKKIFAIKTFGRTDINTNDYQFKRSCLDIGAQRSDTGYSLAIAYDFAFWSKNEKSSEAYSISIWQWMSSLSWKHFNSIPTPKFYFIPVTIEDV